VQALAVAARLAAISRGRRRIRSARSPVTGASRMPQVKAKNTSPAALLLPVRIFTQMPIASHSALSPTVDSTWPAR
jgi:hypothetical protein